MTSNAKRNILIAVAVVLALWMLTALVSSNTADAAERRVTSVTRTDEGVFTTWEQRGACSSGGTLRGWYFRYQRKSFPTGIVVYTYGYWGGSFCSTNSNITSVNWDSPSASVNPVIGWQYQGDSIVANDNSGPARSRKYEGHFSFTGGPGPLTQHDYPWLKVSIRAGQAPSMTKGCSGSC